MVLLREPKTQQQLKCTLFTYYQYLVLLRERKKANWYYWGSGLSSNQGEKSINLYFIMVLLRKKVLKYGTPKPREPLSR